MHRGVLAGLMAMLVLNGCTTLTRTEHISSRTESGIIIGITRTSPNSNVSFGSVGGMPGFSWTTSSPTENRQAYLVTVRLDNGSSLTLPMKNLEGYQVGDRVLIDDAGIRHR
ncbi:MAG: hypothetical protein KGQ58_04960 [Proteobacteria bacterium]|nr:hypothetical protein [Pseudomonadota bacterium]MDE3207746.1 hypothetical protein [Pseudomonadota bacterium]